MYFNEFVRRVEVVLQKNLIETSEEFPETSLINATIPSEPSKQGEL